MKTLFAIAEEINSVAAKYRMRDFQEIRRQIHVLSRPKTYKIFSAQTTFENWAFHSGGRKELQFNIGFEGSQSDWLRYGVAFSLERSKTLPEPLVLKPKVLKMNEYITENLTEMEDIRFWYWNGNARYPAFPVTPPVTLIPEELICEPNFLFWGKIAPRDNVTPEEVLFLFDRLLHVYEYVEGDAPLIKHPAEFRKGFLFEPGHIRRVENTLQHTNGATREIELRHNKLQSVLYSILLREYGDGHVRSELDTGRSSRIDFVALEGDKYLYYEIKTGPDIRLCLREAIAQLIEYSYWPGGNEAAALVVVSENPLTPDARRYLNILRERFHLPIFYRCLDVINATLDRME